MSAIRIACVGAGHHASWTLYPTLQYIPEVEMVAICDLNETKSAIASKRFGFARTYTDYAQMLAKETVDAVICCGGPALHALVTETCIRDRLPVFTEKPPALSAADTKRLAELADRMDGKVMVGFMHRYATVTEWAKKAMQTPEFGTVVMLSAREGIWGAPAKHLVIDSGIHHIDLLLALGGSVDWLFAARNSFGQKRTGIAVILHFKSGIVGQLSINSLESLSTPSDVVEIHGNNGQWIRTDNWNKATWFKDFAPIHEAPEDPKDSIGLYEGPVDPRDSCLVYDHSWTAAATNRATLLQGYVGEFRHFFDCLTRKTKPKPDLWDGYRAMAIVEAINQSADTCEKVWLTP
jgi:predicted dehydrogenase